MIDDDVTGTRSRSEADGPREALRANADRRCAVAEPRPCRHGGAVAVQEKATPTTHQARQMTNTGVRVHAGRFADLVQRERDELQAGSS